MSKILNRQWLHQILILIVILLAAWLRLWRLSEGPLWLDEAYNAMDALWILETHSLQPFFVDNNGRETMLHYLGAFSMSILGATPFAFRLVAVSIGILTIPLTYRWVVTLFATRPDHRWLALIAATGLGTSFWHVLTSRSGFRTILIPFFVILTTYLFWYGWQNRSLFYFTMAGITLGLSQYTYLSARVLPLVFGLFMLIWSITGKKQSLAHTPIHTMSTSAYSINLKLTQLWPTTFSKASPRIKVISEQRAGWLGLLIMAVVSGVVFLPLGLFFLGDHTAFSMRTSQSFIWNEIARDKIPLTEHLLNALSVFTIPYDLVWGMGIPGRVSFGWLNIGAFWIGLIVTIRNFRQPKYLLLLASLFVLWLPGFLSDIAVHTLRLSGMLPAYYILVSVGLITAASLISKQLHQQHAALWLRFAAFSIALITNGWMTTYDYFTRWVDEPAVHQDLNGPLDDLTRYLITESEDNDILLPFRIYAQPTIRFLLYDEFQEKHSISTVPASNRPLLFVDPKPRLNKRLHHVRSSSFVWLTRDELGRGIAYVSRQPPPPNFALAPMG